MLRYQIELHPDTDGTLRVEIPDLPGVNACGPTRELALVNALEAIEVLIDMYVEDGEPVPMPSERRQSGEVVSVPEQLEGRIRAWNQQFMRASR